VESVANAFLASDGNSAIIKDVFSAHNESLPLHLESDILKIAYLHFLNPVSTAKDIMAETGISIDDLTEIYSWLNSSNNYQDMMTSEFYPFTSMLRYSKTLVNDLVKDPDYFNKLVNGLPLSPKRLEIHATNANCNLLCEMCLWRAGQDELEYTPQEIQTGVLSIEQWKSVIKEAHDLDTEIIIFSGGGEPQLREESYQIINLARELNQKVMIYTNGTLLKKLAEENSPLYSEFLASDWLRVSLHAATNETYSKLVGLPPDRDNLGIVISGIESLVSDKEKYETELDIGMNIVLQKSNFTEIMQYMQLAKNLGVDFVNIRVDCVNITTGLNEDEQDEMYGQLNQIRSDYLNGNYKMYIDFSDVLIAPMNGWTQEFTLKETPQCRVNLYRAAINPYGRVGVCDLMAEPHYSTDEFTLGYLSEKSFTEIMHENAGRFFPGDVCGVCMPGQISINSVYHKVISDSELGIQPGQQFYANN